MRKMQRIAALGLAGTMALSLAACGGSGDKGQPLDLTILHINDHHSQLDAETTALTLKDAAGASKSVTVELGGFARVSAAIEALAAGKPNVLKLHAGDALTGDLYFTQSEGQVIPTAPGSSGCREWPNGPHFGGSAANRSDASRKHALTA